ncbi:MAG: hypothetical protein AAFX50_10970, partial [Acidobacteriota bacterium]
MAFTVLDIIDGPAIFVGVPLEFLDVDVAPALTLAVVAITAATATATTTASTATIVASFFVFA